MNKILYLNPQQCEDPLSQQQSPITILGHLCANVAFLHSGQSDSKCRELMYRQQCYLPFQKWGLVCIPLGVYSNMQFYISCNISWPSPWITLQFPIFGNQCLTYYNKQWFCFITGRQHRTICPFYLQVHSEDEPELWLKSVLCTVLQYCSKTLQ
jgi:hypothetical protein